MSSQALPTVPVATLSYEGSPCDKCDHPVIGGNSITLFESYTDMFQLLANGDRHLLPVIIGGAVICEGSPSRAQYLHGQSPDPRGTFPLNQAAIPDKWHGYGSARFFEYNRVASSFPWKIEGGTISCPSCHSKFERHHITTVKEGHILVFNCQNCKQTEDTELFLLPYDPSETCKMINGYDFALMGVEAMILAAEKQLVI